MSRRNADRYYRDEQADLPAPRKRVDWTNVAAGLLVAVGGAVFGRIMLKSDALDQVQTKAQIIPDRRDREIDALHADLRELRKTVMERPCRE